MKSESESDLGPELQSKSKISSAEVRVWILNSLTLQSEARKNKDNASLI